MSQPVVPPLCTICKHFQPADAERPKATCRAFPDGIPDEVWFSSVDHRESLNGEVPVFEKREDLPDEAVKKWEEMYLFQEEAVFSDKAGWDPVD